MRSVVKLTMEVKIIEPQGEIMEGALMKVKIMEARGEIMEEKIIQ